MPLNPPEIGEVGRKVAATIRRLRRSQRITQRGLVDRLDAVGCHIPLIGVNRIEQENRRVNVDELVALARIFGVTPNELLTGECGTCHGTAPEGFACKTCGAGSGPAA